MNAPWTPRALKGDWRDYLTGAERRAVEAAERKHSEARAALAEASALLHPIRMRACQRRLYAERAQALEAVRG
ncbi:hypothetical protein SB2_07475 [Methylobacterium radiotolerans]|nr:hypothetical protein SB3_06345 [Methylobacterium radiotolerans]KTS48829.1 hypothetical protein SB2_07475 [Methylobacterium radiotolerans]